MIKVSRARLQALKNIDEHAHYEGGWQRAIYTYHNDLMVKAGLLERRDIDYQPPPKRVACYRLTALGRAILGRNES